MKYIVFNTETGEISKVGEVPTLEDANLQLREGESVTTSITYPVNSSTQYVDNNMLVNKQRMSLTVSGTTISNLPSPCVIYVGTTRYETVDTSITITDIPSVRLSPGPHIIRVSSPHYMIKTVNIKV